LQNEHRVGRRKIFEISVAGLERLEHGLHGFEVRNGIVRRYESERVGDVGWEAVVQPQRIRVDAGVFPLAEYRVGERRCVAADRRFRFSSALLERPARVALGALPVAREDAGLEDRDRAAPTTRRRVVPALAVSLACSVEPLLRGVRTSFHDQREPRSGGGVAHACQLALARVGIVRVGQTGFTVAVPLLLPQVVRMPIRHDPILMQTTFHGLEFLTAPGRVFTPRATTEALVDAALAHIEGRPVRVADVGTGAGVIGVTIAVAQPQVEVYATDINSDAVELARENAARHGVADRVHVFEGDLLDPVPQPVDLVVANLPYLPEEEAHPEYDDEPHDSIYAPGDGLGPLRKMLHICEAGKLAMPGFALVQYRGNVLEADCQHLPQLREQLATRAAAA
jgi:methylase of polypeptide subunit release factors